MKNKPRKMVEIQKLSEKIRNKDASHGEHSPYGDDFNKRRGAYNKGEHELANPDVLPLQEVVSPSTPQLIMGEAVQHLQGRQKEVYLLLMRENKTYEEVSEILGIKRGAAQMYKKRAIKFIESYCKQAIAKGRV